MDSEEDHNSFFDLNQQWQ